MRMYHNVARRFTSHHWILWGFTVFVTLTTTAASKLWWSLLVHLCNKYFLGGTVRAKKGGGNELWRESLQNLVPARLSVQPTAPQWVVTPHLDGGVITTPRLQRGCRNTGETSVGDLCCTRVLRVSVRVYGVLKNSTCRWGLCKPGALCLAQDVRWYVATKWCGYRHFEDGLRSHNYGPLGSGRPCAMESARRAALCRLALCTQTASSVQSPRMVLVCHIFLFSSPPSL